MPYIDCEYYTTQFCGTPIDEIEFNRLAVIASDLIDSTVHSPFTIDSLGEEEAECVRKATAYQVETLFLHGGVDAAVGMGALAAQSESLGDYSITNRSGLATNSHTSIPTHNGIPVSPFVDGLLRRAGLMTRWAYAGKTHEQLRKGGVYG